MRRITAVAAGLLLGLVSMWMLTAHAQTAPEVLFVALGEQSDSGQTGWAMLTAKRDQTEVVVALNPGNDESKLMIIHTGSCNSRFAPDSLGPLAYELTNLVGGASVTMVGATLDSLRSGFFAINSHKRASRRCTPPAETSRSRPMP